MLLMWLLEKRNVERCEKMRFCGGPIGPRHTQLISRLRDRHRTLKYKKIRPRLKSLRRSKHIAITNL